MDTLIELGKFLISTSVIGGVIVWIFKEFLKLKFSKEVEKQKGEIDNYFHKEKLKFTKLHEERALVIRELYSRLFNYHKSLKSNLKDVENVSEVEWEVKKKNIDTTFLVSKEFSDYYHKNRILLSSELCDQIEMLKNSHLEALKKITISHFLASNMESASSLEERVDDYLGYEKQLRNIVEVEILALEKQLENEFRKILGVIEK